MGADPLEWLGPPRHGVDAGTLEATDTETLRTWLALLAGYSLARGTMARPMRAAVVRELARREAAQ
jgi:hypothetical protein